MRGLRTTLASAWFLALTALTAPAADDLTKQLLTFRPSFKGVDYELPTDAAALAACKGERIAGGFQLRDGQGKVLCRLMHRMNPPKIDQWSYYQDGFEVYRELDNNGDKSLDEIRWMNSGGTRIAKVVGGKIVSWTRISAEEASKVLVQSLVLGETDLLESVMASAAELDALGIPKGELDQVAAAEKVRVAQIKALRASLFAAGWDAGTTWLGLNGAMPHLIPAESGLKDDIILCESATIFAGSPATQANPGKVAFLQVGEMIRLGETWKFVDLPRVVDPSKNNGMIAVAEGGIRSWVFRAEGNAQGGGENPLVAQAMQELMAYDNSKESQALQTSGVPKDSARFHVGRVTPLKKVVKAAEVAGDPRIELDHQKLIVDSVSAAYATGQYPGGVKVLEQFTTSGGKIGTYAAFKQIEADFVLQNAADPGNGLMVQEKWLANLTVFVDKNPTCDEAPQALLLLASTNELNGKETEGKKSYTVLAKDYPATEWGKKAAGALRRLDLVGKPMTLKGTDLRGQSLDTAQYRGKTLLITFWGTMASPARRDLPELVKLQAKYKAKGFEVISVNLDNDKADLDAFLQASPLPWPQIFEPGGLDSRLAVEFGIISLPTMFLVDPDGKVSNRTLRTAGELEVLLDRTLTGKVALAPGN